MTTPLRPLLTVMNPTLTAIRRHPKITVLFVAGLLLIVAALLLPKSPPPGDPRTYARLARITDCSELGDEFDAYNAAAAQHWSAVEHRGYRDAAKRDAVALHCPGASAWLNR